MSGHKNLTNNVGHTKSTDLISAISLQVEPTNEQSQDNDDGNKLLDPCCKGGIISCIFISVIVAFCAVIVTPWTTIPRTNSIYYQSYWMEANLPIAATILLYAAMHATSLAIWAKERTLMSILVLLKLWALHFIIWFLFYVFVYVLWTVHFEFNHPLPLLGALVTWLTTIFGMLGLRLALPHDLMQKEEFRRKLRVYKIYYFWIVIFAILLEIVSTLFINLPSDFQFVVAFILPACRELNRYVTSKLVNKMMEQKDEEAYVLIGINVNAQNAFFIATRLINAERATVACFVGVDFIFHLSLTYQIIKGERKISNQTIEDDNLSNARLVIALVLSEIIEGITHIAYASCVAMAYFGPNANILGGIGCSYWAFKAIDEIWPLLGMMIVLFAVDTFSVALNFVWIWRATKKNTIPEFYRVFGSYWYLMAIVLSFNLVANFAGRDVNFASDLTGDYNWITQEGWIDFVFNATDLTDETKTKLLKNFTLSKKLEFKFRTF